MLSWKADARDVCEGLIDVRSMRRTAVAVVLALVSAGVVVTPPGGTTGAGPPAGGPAVRGAAALPPLFVLEPGAVGFLVEPLPINVVFVGYDEGDGPADIDVDRLLSAQPEVSFGINRFPLLYDRVIPSHTAVVPSYDLTFADDEFTDDFFSYLASIGEAGPPTEYQERYNSDPAATRTIHESVDIDAPAVERWLAEQSSMLGLTPGEPTVFFVNWFGRDDFRHHTYTKLGAPDTDTGVDFGDRDALKMIAWGGTAAEPGDEVHRIWFHDLSAGPDHLTVNWNLSDADVDGDGIADYRLPPIWEYGNESGYRPFDDVTGDLGKVLRFVALNLLFAPSPLYPPSISPPLLPTDISIDITRVVGDGQPPSLIDPDEVVARVSELQPWNTFTVAIDEIPYSGRLASVHRCWLSSFSDPTFVGSSCFGHRSDGFAALDLWLYLTDQWARYTGVESDHSIPTLVFEVSEDEAAQDFIAVADRDHTDGTQSHIVSYATPRLTDAGLGQTDTLVHEIGHHLGLPHPHDGLDHEAGVHYVATADFHFAWVGDASDTVMNYYRHSHSFSQFDRDNMGRWMTVAHLNQAQQVLAKIVDSPRAHRVLDDIVTADLDALFALIGFQAMDYRTAASIAQQAYHRLVDAAASIRVPIEPQARQADIASRGVAPFFVDPMPAVDGSARTAPPGPATYPVSDDLPVVDLRSGPSGSLDRVEWVTID